MSFGTWNGTHWSHFCGGSIISDRTIISASHCFFLRPNRYGPRGYQFATRIRIGDQNLNDATDDRLAKTYTVNTIIRHKKYAGRGIFYDVALVHTVEKIEFNGNAAPICMTTVANPEVVIPGEEVAMAGWGYVDDSVDRKPSDTLQETNAQILKRSGCRQQTPGIDDDLVICVGSPVSYTLYPD